MKKAKRIRDLDRRLDRVIEHLRLTEERNPTLTGEHILPSSVIESGAIALAEEDGLVWGELSGKKQERYRRSAFACLRAARLGA